jgi:hypothetical protein
VDALDRMVLETTDLKTARAVEQALRKAKIRFDLRFERRSLREGGMKEVPKRFWVAQECEATARQVVEEAIVRRARVLSLQPKPGPAGSGFAAGSSGVGFGFLDVCEGGVGGDGGSCD